MESPQSQEKTPALVSCSIRFSRDNHDKVRTLAYESHLSINRIVNGLVANADREQIAKLSEQDPSCPR